MTAPAPVAKLAYITDPGPDEILLNVQTEGDEVFRQFRITRDQLFNINADSANILAGRKDD